MTTKISKTPNMKNLNGLTAVGFLLMITQKYGYIIENVGYIHIAIYLSSRGEEWVSPISVRAYFFKLEELGYIQIDNKGRRNIRFTIIKDRVDKLLGINEQQQKSKYTFPVDYIEPTQIGDHCILPNNYALALLQLPISKLQIKLFMLIYAEYQSVSYKKKAVCPFYASYVDFAKALKCNDTKRIKNEIKALIETGIIQRTTDRKGRAKYGYIVDNKALNDMAENV